MKRVLIIVGIVLVGHVVASFVIPPYTFLLFATGALLTDANGVEDLPRAFLVGSIAVGCGVALIATGVALYIRKPEMPVDPPAGERPI